MTRVCREDVLVLILSGTLRFTENGRPVEVGANQYYIQKSGICQQGELESDAPHYFYIHFLGHFSQTGGLPTAGTFYPDRMASHLQRLSECESARAPRLEKALAFYIIIKELYRSGSRSPLDYTIAQQIERYLISRFAHKVSLSELERDLNYSKDYLIRVFKRQYGTTPYRFLTELRMRQARQLLLSTNRPVEQIARECGYQDASAFHRAFVHAHGISPLRWKSRETSV